jgi:hypothetical protein
MANLSLLALLVPGMGEGMHGANLKCASLLSPLPTCVQLA